MLAWVMINRQHPRQAAPKSLSLRTAPAPTRSGCLYVKLSGSFPPTSVVSTGYGHPSTTAAPPLLCNQSVTHAFCLDGGCTPLGVSTAYPLLPMPYLLSYHTLAHSFALSKISTPLFSIDSALFAQNTRGWGTHLLGSMWPRGIASKVE
jgi:hypothetical protein